MESLSIVIPAFNEENNVSAVLNEVSTVARWLGMDYEIILVNDGSRDATGMIAHQMTYLIPNLRVIDTHPNRGYGGALKTGFSAATRSLVAFFPADGQYRFEEIRLLLARIAQADIVCGYRHERQDPLVCRVNALGWNLLVRALFGYLCRDVNCGFKLFHRDLLNFIPLDSDGAMIDTEFLAIAHARKLRIIEVPVTHLPRVSGAGNGTPPAVIARALCDLFAFRLRLTRLLASEPA